MPMTPSDCLIGMLIIGMFASLIMVSKVHWWWICKRNKPYKEFKRDVISKGSKKDGFGSLVFSIIIASVISFFVLKCMGKGTKDAVLTITLGIIGFIFLMRRLKKCLKN